MSLRQKVGIGLRNTPMETEKKEKRKQAWLAATDNRATGRVDWYSRSLVYESTSYVMVWCSPDDLRFMNLGVEEGRLFG